MNRLLPAGDCSATRVKPSGPYFGACVAVGGAAPLVTAVVASSPSRVTTVATSGSSILTTVHHDGLRFGVCRR